MKKFVHSPIIIDVLVYFLDPLKYAACRISRLPLREYVTGDLFFRYKIIGYPQVVNSFVKVEFCWEVERCDGSLVGDSIF